MAPIKKGRRKSKPPARLDEFLCEDAKEKENEPRRSGRTPKITEKLKRFMDDQGGVAKDQNGGQMKKERQITVTTGHHLLGSKYKEPKVVLKALPKSLLQKGTRKYPLYKNEARVTLKRLGNAKGNTKAKRVFISKLHKQKPGLSKAALSASSNTLLSALEKKELKIELEDISQSTGRVQQKRKGKRKRASAEHELQPQGKYLRMSPRMSERKDKKTKAKDKKSKGKDKKTKGKDNRFDPDVMKNLFNFGAKVEEVLVLNKDAINQLIKDNTRTQSFTQMVSDKLEDIDENDIEKVLKWLEEEERHRKEHREKVLESLRVSHSTNIALYSHMLSVLQSVTASI